MTKTEAYEITLAHLIQMFGEDEALEIFAEHKADMFNYHGFAWHLGKQSLPYFCEIFLHDLLFDYSGDKIPLSNLHYEIWAELQDTMLNKNNTRHVYVLPRGFGKTTTITVVVALWTALYCIHPLTVIQSAAEKMAEAFVSVIRTQIEENEYIKSCFGDVINKNMKNNALELELDVKPQRSKIWAFSSTGMIRGVTYNSNRIGLLLVDDGQNVDNLKTEANVKELFDKFSGGAMKALETANNHVIALGTIFRVDDLYDKLLHSSNWVKKRKRCIDIDDIDYYFNHNEHWLKIRAIKADESNPNNQDDARAYYLEHKEECDFPVIWEKYNCYDLFGEWVDNPVTFKREMQCDITALGEKRISSVATMPSSEIEKLEFTKTILAVDPAAATSKKADYSAFCILSEGYTNCKYVRKLKIDKLGFEDYIETIIQLLKLYTDINGIFIEKNVFLGADVIKLRERIQQDSELRYRPLMILNKSTTRNKDNRIDAIIPDINNHRLVFNAEDTEAIEQIKEFAGTAFTAHDDAIDSLCLAVENLPEISTGGTYGYISFREIYG